MIRFFYTSFAICFLVLSSARGEEDAAKGDSDKILREISLSRRVNSFFLTPYVNLRNAKWSRSENPIDTNEVGAGNEERPTFLIFRTYEAPREFLQPPPLDAKTVIEVRKKREVESVPETTLVGKIRNKRTYCHKCGGGGGGRGGYYPGGGGGFGGHGGYGGYGGHGGYGGYGGHGGGGYGGHGGGGCRTCGGGYGGYGGQGGGYSFSSSSSQSSAGGFGFGK